MTSCGNFLVPKLYFSNYKTVIDKQKKNTDSSLNLNGFYLENVAFIITSNESKGRVENANFCYFFFKNNLYCKILIPNGFNSYEINSIDDLPRVLENANRDKKDIAVDWSFYEINNNKIFLHDLSSDYSHPFVLNKTLDYTIYEYELSSNNEIIANGQITKYKKKYGIDTKKIANWNNKIKRNNYKFIELKVKPDSLNNHFFKIYNKYLKTESLNYDFLME